MPQRCVLPFCKWEIIRITMPCFWRSWKIKFVTKKSELISTDSHPFLIFHDLQEQSSNLSLIPLKRWWSLISKIIKHIYVAGLVAEISLFEVGTKYPTEFKLCHSQSSNIHNFTVLRATEAHFIILEMRKQGLNNGKCFRWLLSLPESWKLLFIRLNREMIQILSTTKLLWFFTAFRSHAPTWDKFHYKGVDLSFPNW